MSYSRRAGWSGSGISKKKQKMRKQRRIQKLLAKYKREEASGKAPFDDLKTLSFPQI